MCPDGPAANADDPAVTVVVPTRDRPESMARAVATALGQTRPPLEVLVVDDGSRPPVRPAPRTRVLRNDTPAGPGAARNRAAAEARGVLLAFLDDDDRWRPGLLARMVAEMQEQRAAAVVCGWELHHDDVVLDTVAPPPSADLRRRLLQEPSVVPSCLVVTAEAFASVGGFDPTLRFGEDWDLALRLTEAHRVVTVPDILVEREAHPHARYGHRLVGDHWEMMRRLRPRVARRPPAERWVARGHQGLRLAQYGLRVAIEPIVVGRGPWRIRHDRRQRRARLR